MSRYREVATKVDRFFERVHLRYASQMQCSSGCSDCCAVRLTVTQLEANEIINFVVSSTPERRAALAANVAANVAAGTTRCAALDPAGRCMIYDARPVVCRSHGVPIRMARDAITACHRNFTEQGPAAAAPDCILDQTTLSALVLAADREAGGDGSRIDLAKLLASASLDVDAVR